MENITLSKRESHKAVSVGYYCIQCDFHAEQIRRGEILDERYAILHKLYYELLSARNSTLCDEGRNAIICELESLENQIAQILLAFDEVDDL